MAGFGDPHLSTVDAAGLRLGIVGSRWHSGLVDHMVERAQQAAKACGVQDVIVARVAGSVELPVVAQALAKRCDAVVALGVVIRGETAHFDYVAGQAAAGITNASLETGIPITFGVLTTENVDQAVARAGGKLGNKGFEAALAAIETANLLASLPKPATDL